MRGIYIEPGSLHLLNIGDVAMLQAAFRRFRGLWPDSPIYVTTANPQLLQLYCPGAVPLSATDRDFFLRHRSHWPLTWLKPALRLAANRYADAIRHCDLIAASGCGIFNDSFTGCAGDLLAALEFAANRRIPVVLLGHGFGPLQDPALLQHCRRVLPRLSLITLREKRHSLPLLRQIGVPPERILVSGDEAIRVAFQHLPDALGSGLGVNIRIAGYAIPRFPAELQHIVQQTARELKAPLHPFAISQVDEEADSKSNRKVFEGYPDIVRADDTADRVTATIRQIGRCRTVITASYHGAVFALAQGVSAVTLAASPYYRVKFEGLADQFGSACSVVSIDQPGWVDRLSGVIERAWECAPRLRPELLAAAQRQIEASDQAYRKICQECP